MSFFNIFKRLEKLEFHKNRQIDENRKVSIEIDDLRDQINSLKMMSHSHNENLCSSTFNVQKTKGLSFEEASKMTYKLKKIKRKCWNKNLTIEVGNGFISMDKEILDNFHLHKLENDWEIVE